MLPGVVVLAVYAAVLGLDSLPEPAGENHHGLLQADDILSAFRKGQPQRKGDL
jgi:hypothetical protein